MLKNDWIQTVRVIAYDISINKVNSCELLSLVQKIENKDYFSLSYDFQRKYSNWALKALGIRGKKIPTREYYFFEEGSEIFVQVFETKINGVFLRKCFYPPSAKDEKRRNRKIFVLTGSVFADHGDYLAKNKVQNNGSCY